ncbi:MAG: hypothetical protein BWY96_02927 [Spirochaetes bacterium ADurb.BinA120]|nr:MAG: hypothetical protein BWY96_02927 [Spirochaetes bacterium ADurb.BinA120]
MMATVMVSMGFTNLKALRNFLLSALILSGSAAGTFMEPFTASAFRFLLPITAPRPERAAIRPASVTIPEMRESFSPALPMQATWALFSFTSARISSSVSTVSFPQIFFASLISTFPSLM